jgi:uncharacterized membrane protein YgdD (TMEM256/DUF423 family)
MRQRDLLTRLAAVSAAIAVAAAAYASHGAHGLAADWLRTGAFYQLVHAVAVVAFAGRWRGAALLLLTGATIFAVTLYAMAFGAPHWLGAITPIGGAGMIAGWLWVATGRR